MTASDRLHETGCCLCGARSAHFSLLVGEHAGSRWCDKCEDLYPTVEQLRAEITRRKSLASTPRQAFEVGQWVEWDLGGRNVGELVTNVSPEQWRARRLPRDNADAGDIRDVWTNEIRPWQPQPGEAIEWTWLGQTVRGVFVGYAANGEVDTNLGSLLPEAGETIRPARPATPQEVEPATPAKAAPEWHGRPPNCGDCGKPIASALEACKRTRFVNGRNEFVPGAFHAKCPTKPTESEQPARAVDPYANDGLRPAECDVAECSAPMNNMTREARIAALRASTNPLDRLAAARSSRQREVVVRESGSVHPRSWPEGACDDADEIYSTL